jgi:hypothetical protein
LIKSLSKRGQKLARHRFEKAERLELGILEKFDEIKNSDPVSVLVTFEDVIGRNLFLKESKNRDA